jgi:septum formation protein
MLILASRSLTRKTLLEGAGLPFAVDVAAIDERAVESAAVDAGADARQVAVLLAEAKATEVSARRPADLVIGADQTLALGPELLHKPGSPEAAIVQLDRLAGKTHRLHAGIALATNGRPVWSLVDTAELTMRAFTADERDAVLELEGDSVLNSVGGYRLEGPSIRLFEAVRGDYFTILGLPLLPLLEALREQMPELFVGSAAR